MLFSRRIKLFGMFGIGVRLDVSWPLPALIVVWTLADGVFPAVRNGALHGQTEPPEPGAR